MTAIAPPPTRTPLLKYALQPIPDPPQAGGSLTLRFVASKPRETSQVFCDRITVSFPVDAVPCTDPAALATASGQQTATPADWDPLDPHDAGVFTFLPKGSDEVTTSYTFDVFDIDVSPLVGTATVAITEHSTDHDEADCTKDNHDDCYVNSVVSFDVPKFPPGFTGVDFKADRTAVPPGGDVTLSWQVEPVASYQLLEGADPIDPAKITHTTVGDTTTWSFTARKLADDTVFTLRVGYEEAETKLKREIYVPVDVQRPSLTLLVQGRRTTVRPQEHVTFKWQIAYVQDCALYTQGADGQAHRVQAVDDNLPSFDVAPVHTTTYLLKGTTGSGDNLTTITSNPVTIYVVPAAPQMTADLVFIKTANPGGNVEMHVTAGAGGFQQRLKDVTSAFGADMAANGTWILRRESNGKNVLLFVQQRQTAAGYVEIHWDPPTQGETYDPNTTTTSTITPFREADAPNGTWLIPVMDEYSGPDVFFVMTAATASGRVELLMQNGAELAGYTRWVTAFSAGDGPKGTWLLTGLSRAGVWPPDLAFIQTSGTASGQVELSYATAATGYQGSTGPFVTAFDCGDAADGTWQLADMNGDGKLDLAFVRTANTESGRVEVHYAAAGDGYQILQGGYTEFDVSEGPNGTWQLLPGW